MTQPLTPESDAVEVSLYEQRQKIYPRKVTGTFATLRVTAVLVLLGIFYLFPWISINDVPLVLFDLPARKFHVFGLVFWPQDFIYLTFLLMICAFSLFFFTALAGRLWCGYACPQTVWTETFLWIERMVEGDRPKQMKLDKMPLCWKKVRVKATKHFLWITFSLFTGFTFVAYFTPAPILYEELMTWTLGPWETFWGFFYGFATYGNAGFMREQVCKYMCPYARFQSAMFDDNTLVVSYDQQRGEPRGSRKVSANPDEIGLGSCVDCTMCVQVCPTGIDIRDGLQYECIGCSACIDVCDSVMKKMNYAPGLIRYTTQNAIDGKESRVIRPRTIIYALILISIFSLFAWSVFNRIPVGLDVIRDRNQLFRESQGRIENIYTLKLINMHKEAQTYSLAVTGMDDLQLKYDADELRVESGLVYDLPVRVSVNEDEIEKRSTEIHFTLTSLADDSISITQDAKFIGPLP